MSKKEILCSYSKTQEEALDQAPWPGPLGQHILEHISKKAWSLWLEEQTRLINEHRLAVYKTDDKAFLMQKLKDFFNINNDQL
jgi:Fe-S cluster biosynthesis and repair protein YggX